ncbi:MAG: D-2-hydroxyacid dehydrogenase [Cardiobacteriaceae bacterium]|nr:D-2-hydroxyacid dehydrogenase [Cardiobacteriaceae bacterium]
MKAVFLDRNTFSAALDLPAPPGIREWTVYPATAAHEVIERARGAEIVLTNKVVLDKAIIDALPDLKLVQVCATGINNVDTAACEARGIAVQNVAGYSTESVPEHTWMGILAAMRGLKPYQQAVADGSWQRDGRFTLNDTPVLDLAGKTLTIIGAGNIGRRVSAIGEAFGMQVLWAEQRGRAARSAEYTPFAEALAAADIISLHCPLSEHTRHLINADSIALMQRQPLLVNMARGGVVDGAAVAQAVETGALLGYVSDVFDHEPLPADDPLWRIRHHPRVIYTPHNAWASEGAQRKLWALLSAQVSAFIDNKGQI